MEGKTQPNPLQRHLLVAAVLLLWIAGLAWPALAQDQAPDPTQNQVRERTREQAGEGEQLRWQWQQKLRNGIDGDPALTADERQTMHTNLEACLRLGMPAEDLGLLFPSVEEPRRYSAQTQLRFQQRLLAAAEAGVPVEPLLAKIQEGHTKGVSEQALEQACSRMEEQLRAAQRIMTQARRDGVAPAADARQERRLTCEMAQHMWRGMPAEEIDRLREQARLRLHDGSCSLEDLTAAAEAATRLHEEGLSTERASRVVGEALRQGYRVQEMQQLRLMVQARHQRRGPIEGFVDDLERCLGDGMGAGEMYQHMWQNGWMGPGDMQGPGGPRHIDDVGGGGPRHHGGSGDDDHHGGQGSGSQGSGQGSGQGGGGGR